MEQPLSREEIQSYKQRLLDMRSSLADEVERVESGSLQPSGDPRFQSGDEAIEEAGLDDQIDVLAAEDELGYAVHDALERIREGKYGICATCGRHIARERLELLPYAVECARCAAARSQAQPDAGVQPEKPPSHPPSRALPPFPKRGADFA